MKSTGKRGGGSGRKRFAQPASVAGARMRARRKQLGLRLEDVAKRLKTSRSRVWRLETGETPVHADYLPEVAIALETTPGEFIA